MSDYRTVDDAIRDGWDLWFSPRGPWWAPDRHEYSVLAKRGNYHVELAADSLANLRGAVRMLKSVPRYDLPYTRDWWARKRQGER